MLVESIEIVLVSFALLIIGAMAWQVNTQRRQNRELVQLRKAISCICRNVALPNKIGFSFPLIKSLWQAVLALDSRGRSLEQIQETYHEAMSLSLCLANSSDEELRMVDVLLDLLLQQVRPEVSSVAVMTMEPGSEEWNLLRQKGLPEQRAESALRMCFDLLQQDAGGVKNGWKDDALWGYHLPREGHYFDFTVFGVGMCLIVPLTDGESLRGGIWLGFKGLSVTLTPAKKRWIQAVAEHAAASLESARRARSKQEKSSQERDYLLGMSHDLRSPGNRALFAANELLAGGCGVLTAEQFEQVEIIRHSVEEQLGLLSDVLDYAKHQRGFLEAQVSIVALRQQMFEILRVFKEQFVQLGIPFCCEEVPDILIEVDSRHFKRMLNNLLSNALKYGGSKEVAVRFEKKAGSIYILVCDRGLGVPSEERKHLFQSFRRGEKAKSCEGVGLGLALTKALVELNKGEVIYRPHLGGGSVFGLCFPFQPANSRESSLERPILLDFVLVADDDHLASRTVVRFVRELAQRSVPVASLAEIREFVKNDKPSLLISDFHLEDGVFTEIFDELPESIPVIIVSGSSDPRLFEKRFRRPLVKILEKPFERGELVRMIEQLVEESRRFEAGQGEIKVCVSVQNGAKRRNYG